MGLETKTISILPIISFLQKRRRVEASIKYFVVQAIAAAMILNAALIKI
ncbi:proton-conducting transporter membrane subunit [Salmonella sp. s51090]